MNMCKQVGHDFSNRKVTITENGLYFPNAGHMYLRKDSRRCCVGIYLSGNLPHLAIRS